MSNRPRVTSAEINTSILSHYTESLKLIAIDAKRELGILLARGVSEHEYNEVAAAYFANFCEVYAHAIKSVDQDLFTKTLKKIAVETRNSVLNDFIIEVPKERIEKPVREIQETPIRHIDDLFSEITETILILREAKNIESQHVETNAKDEELDLVGTVNPANAAKLERYKNRYRDFKPVNLDQAELKLLAERYNANLVLLQDTLELISLKELPDDIALSKVFDRIYKARINESTFGVGAQGLENAYTSMFEKRHAASVKFGEMVQPTAAKQTR